MSGPCPPHAAAVTARPAIHRDNMAVSSHGSHPASNPASVTGLDRAAPPCLDAAMRALVVGALVMTACGGGHDQPTADAPTNPVDAPAGTPDAPVEMPDAGPCATIDNCGWLIDYQQDIVGRLSGQREITPGVTLPARASNAQRTTARDFVVAEFTRLGYTPSVQAYAANAGNVIATLAPDGAPSGDALIV